MVELIKREIPYICTVSANNLSSADRFILEKVHKVSVDNFILVDHKKDCIFINKDLDNVSEIKELIIKIMHSKYLPEKLLDRFQELTNDDADRILIGIFHDRRHEKMKKALHDSALAELKKSKSLRIHWTVKRNKEIIKELFDIGFGLYDKGAKCNYQQGAENAFMYGYLLGVQSQKANS